MYFNIIQEMMAMRQVQKDVCNLKIDVTTDL